MTLRILSALALSLFLWTPTARATVLAGTSQTTPLPFNQFNTFAMIGVQTNGNRLEMGFLFTIPGDGPDYFLDNLIVPLRSITDDNTVRFSLYDQDPNFLRPGSVLESAEMFIEEVYTYSLRTFLFSGNSKLEAGRNYFLIGSITDPTSQGIQQIDWAGSSPAATVQQFYRVTPPGGWNTIINNNGPAYQINATEGESSPVPEPNMFPLLTAGVFAVVVGKGVRKGLRKRRNRVF